MRPRILKQEDITAREKRVNDWDLGERKLEELCRKSINSETRCREEVGCGDRVINGGRQVD